MVIRTINDLEKLRSVCSAEYSLGPHVISKKRRVANEIHRVFSIKAGFRIVDCEGPLEASIVIWAESNPEITFLCEQPLRMLTPIGKKPFYTIDLMLRFKHKADLYVEIKEEKNLIEGRDGRMAPENWDLISAWFTEKGICCDFFTERKIQSEHQLIENWRKILPFARFAYEYKDPHFENMIINYVKTSITTKINDIVKITRTHSFQDILAYVSKLLHQGKLHARLNDRPFRPNTEIFLGSNHNA